MNRFRLQSKKAMAVICALLTCAGVCPAQQNSGALRGQVTDEHNAVIAGTTATLVAGSGGEITGKTDERGVFSFEDLAPGRYTLRMTMIGFAPFEKRDVIIERGRRVSLDIKLRATIEKQQVNVESNVGVLSTDPRSNRIGLVLKGKEIEALPDDPDDLAATLQILGGPSAGPNGGQLFIDGFAAAGRAPQKSAISEIQINQNPFAAEHDRIGFGRIEIFTKPGSAQLHGGLLAIFNDEQVNARNPFSSNRAAFQVRAYSGNLSGTLLKKRASFFLSAFRREIDDNAVISATVLDSNFNIKPLNQSLLTPKRFLDAGARFDFALNQRNTLAVRFNYSSSNLNGVGVGQFSLASRAYELSGSDQNLQLTETAAVSAKLVNETRFQFVASRIDKFDPSSQPALVVMDSFTGGGSQVGLSYTDTRRWEAQNYTTAVSKNHTVKFGLRLRVADISDVSRANFGGTYTFAGGRAPALDASNRLILGANGQPVVVDVSSAERYRRTVLMGSRGVDPDTIRALGGGATLLTIAGGDPAASVNQVELGAFAQDDWKAAANLTVSFGLRYEAQTNIAHNSNLAPRAAFAWSPRGGAPTTVIRGGFGIFYERFGEALTLQANRFDGTNQRQFIVADPDILDLFPVVPTIETLARFEIPPTVWRVAGDLRTPYTIQSSISIERQLPHNFIAAAAYINSRGSHYLRSRNINAPETVLTNDGTAPIEARPLAGFGNVFEYESDGKFRQHLLSVTASNRLNRRYTLFASYALGSSRADTDGTGTFPADGSNLSAEYGRSSYDIRHRAFLGGLINLPKDISFSPLVIISSGAPFNITTGIDSNGDTLFTERPEFADRTITDGVKVTPWGAFSLVPAPGARMIPRNFGSGPAGYTVNMRLAKTLTIRGLTGRTSEQQRRPGGQQQKATSDRSYKLTASVFVFNLLNKVNRGTPVGNLSSPLFGQSTSLAASAFGLPGSSNAASNRRIDFQLQFSF